jgi:N-acetylglucosamine-6-phosphate deacetylase
MSIAFVNGRIATSSGFADGDVVVDGDRIVSVGVGPGTTAIEQVDLAHRIDVNGAVIAPGFIDLQFNGGWGIDLAIEPERVWELAEHVLHDGVTSFCPTLVSCSDAVRQRFLVTLRAGPPHDGVPRARSLGAHLEGPVLNPVRRGAHPTNQLQLASAAISDEWQRPEVALVTLAPELVGALDLVRALVQRGIVVSAGHTDATFDELLTAADAGVSMVTHLFNAMPPFAHRAPGPIGAVLGSRRFAAGLIVDGVHVHPGAVAMAWHALGCERVCLVTDAVAPMGVIERGAEIRLANGTLAGSNLHMIDAIGNLVAFTGCPVHEAIHAATATPASVVGATDVGVLEPGHRADLVLLDPNDLAIRDVVLAGTIVPRT